MKEHRATCLLLAVLMVVSALPALAGVASAGTTSPTRAVDASTGATPNYREFLESDLKSMPYDGGYYTCLKASAPFTYFSQSYYGVPLSYLLDTEVGLKAGTTGIKVIAQDGYSATLSLEELRMTNPQGQGRH
jgi:hypothetical protein